MTVELKLHGNVTLTFDLEGSGILPNLEHIKPKCLLWVQGFNGMAIPISSGWILKKPAYRP